MGNNFNTCDIPADFNAASLTTGLWRSPAFGSIGLKSALAAASSRLVKFVGFGDSKLAGYYSSSWANKGYFGKLITDMQALYGDGGSGFHSVEGCGYTAGGGTPAGISATGSGGTGIGGWNRTAGNSGGINGIILSAAAAGNGATLTFSNVRGTTIDIYWYRYVGTTNFTYSIDGGSAVTVDTNGAAAIGITTITGLSAGNHTVVLTATVGLPFIWGVMGRNATGIIGINMGRASRRSLEILNTNSSGLSGTEGSQSIQYWNPDVLILDIGTNDANQTDPIVNHRGAGHTHVENTAAAYTQNAATNSTTAGVVRGFNSYLRECVNWARTTAAGAYNPCEVIILNPHQGKGAVEGGSMDPNWSDIGTQVYNVARSCGGAVLDCMVLGNHSWTYWNNLGYWGVTGGTTGAAGTDQVHNSDAGHAVVEAQLLYLLTH